MISHLLILSVRQFKLQTANTLLESRGKGPYCSHRMSFALVSPLHSSRFCLATERTVEGTRYKGFRVA